jgi:membrane fusion protein, multidrug efflux system
MKAARFAAVGIVVAAVGWIASGHLFPRDSAESRAMTRPAES